MKLESSRHRRQLRQPFYRVDAGTQVAPWIRWRSEPERPRKPCIDLPTTAMRWLCELDCAQTSDLLLAMVMAEPLRQMALGLLPPGSDIDNRITAALDLVLPGLLRS